MAQKKTAYPVEFVEDVFGVSPVLARVLKEATGSEAPRILIVADFNVVQRTGGLGAKIGRYLNAHGLRLAASPVVIAGGEKIKADGLQSVLKVVSAILEARLSRGDCVLALGGGSLLDVAGYAAAQARGGVRLVRLPTTPAAMMDAAFSDFAAVDSLSVKDALRVRSVPEAVLVDTSFAATVLDGVWRGGVGEAVRQAVVSDAALLKRLAALLPAWRERRREALDEVVRGAAATRLKKGPCAFADWIASRLEAMSGYKLPRGYAVAIGVLTDVSYAVERGLLPERDGALVTGLLGDCGALDGLAHSRHLFARADDIFRGLDDWALAAGAPGIPLPKGLGRQTVETDVDREIYRKVFQKIVSAPTGA